MGYDYRMVYSKRQPPVIITCPYCKKEFSKPAWYVRKKEAKNGVGSIHCSSECQFLSRWGRKRTTEKPCQWCGKPVVRQESESDKRSTYGPFCNHNCYGKWRSENLVGEDSPAWKGGKSRWYEGNWKSQRAKARKRDNYTCQDCGAVSQNHGYEMDVHHIVDYDLFEEPKEANLLENLVTLCRVCHMRRHGYEMEAK